MRRRRFAGEQMGSLQGFSSDTLAAATEALKQAQTSLKSDTGDRLGPGTQAERDEAVAQKPAAPATPTATAAPAAMGNLSASDITRLRSVLGIDELTTALRLGGEAMASMPKFEMPQFEMPEFKMPELKLPDFSSMFPQKQTQTTDTTTTSTTAVTPTISSKVKVGSKTYDLSKVGGAGLGGGDIKAMQNRGWTTGQIRQAAAQAPRVSAGAQKTLGVAKTQAKAITSKANQAISKSSGKQSGSKKK